MAQHQHGTIEQDIAKAEAIMVEKIEAHVAAGMDPAEAVIGVAGYIARTWPTVFAAIAARRGVTA